MHSILASHQTKEAFARRFGTRAYYGLYRMLFNMIATVTIIPAALLIIFRPGETVWSINLEWELPLMLIQAVGLVGFLVSLLQINLGQFGGLAQLRAYRRGDPLPLPPERLQTGGIYALVRHPLYLFSLMVLWPVTTMTEAYLGFCIGTTLYFLIGSYYEEQRMVRDFGQDYLSYRARVPWLLPLPRPRSTTD